ncbi:MAG: hypothetical protein AAFR31_16840 [Cyanobacteria bacterium J06627_8]
MTHHSEWLIGLLTLNAGLTLVFLGTAWRLNRLRRKIFVWSSQLVNLEEELADALSSQPYKLRSLVTVLHTIRMLYSRAQSAIGNGWQAFIIIRFVATRSMRFSSKARSKPSSLKTQTHMGEK